MSSVDCKEVKNELAIKWLAEHGAEFYCSYCGYVFRKVPQLPTKCPKCGKKLMKICMPIFEPRKRNKV